jgi:hypothetical protein
MKKALFPSIISLAILLFIGIGAVSAQAQSGSVSNPKPTPTGSVSNQPTGSVSNPNPIGFNIPNPFNFKGNLFDLIKKIVNELVLPAGAVLCVLAFIYSGFKYVTSQGDSKAIGEANSALLNSAIGTAVLLGSWTIANVIEGTVNQFK